MGGINIRNHHKQNAVYFRIQQNFAFLSIHSQRSDSCITDPRRRMQNTEAEFLSCQVIGSPGFGTERGVAQLPWAGGEVISIEKAELRIFHLRMCLFCTV